MLQAQMLLGGLSSFGSQFKVWFRFVEQLVLVVPVEVKPKKSVPVGHKNESLRFNGHFQKYSLPFQPSGF